jgi:hypothetical protein
MANEKETENGAPELDTQFAEWVRLYNEGELTPAEFVSEMEFDGFDGDLTDLL